MSGSKKFIKFLKEIGVPVPKSTSQESLNVVLLHKSGQQFFHGISSTMTASNVLNIDEIKEEREMEQLGFLTDENIEDLDYCLAVEESELSDCLNYLNELEEQNLQLLTSDGTRHYNDDSKDKTKEVEAIAECKDAMSQLKRELSSLEKCCSKLQQLSCDCNVKPLMFYQLPLDSYFSNRKLFDTYIKQFIIKQFKPGMFVLSGLNEPLACVQRDPRSLKYFVAGPDKQHYEKLTNQFNKLEPKHKSVLYETSIQEATIKGLQSAITTIENWVKTAAVTNIAGMDRDLRLKVSQLESLMFNNVSQIVTRKIELVATDTIKIKHIRQQYYLENLSKLEQLLRRQYSVDKLVLSMADVEKCLFDHVCSFLQTINHLFQPELDDAIRVLTAMETLNIESGKESCVNPKVVNGSSELQASSEMLFKNQSEDIINLKISRLINWDDNLEAIFSRTLQCRKIQNRLLEESSNDLQKHSVKLGPEAKEFHNQLSLLLAEYNKEKLRREQCPVLHILSGLWAVFVTHPEKFNDVSQD